MKRIKKLELRKFIFLIVLVCLLSEFSSGQEINLKPFIGQSVRPQDSDIICDIPFAPDKTFNSYGYKIGDTIPDFTLYTIDNKEFNIKAELLKGKPVLLVTGSYTCPVFRLRYMNMNAIANDFGDRLSPYFVYVVEAHPIVDVSPYTNSPGEVWVTPQNEADGVFYRQPKTYFDRKEMVKTAVKNLNIVPNILIDGPGNEYWTHFGPGAVIAYLIKPDGVIAGRNSWFNSWMTNKGYCMMRDIRTLLAKTTKFDSTTVFTTKILQNTVKGIPGNSLELTSEIINTSDKEMFIDIKVADQTIPMDWMVNFSADGGFPIDMDSVVMYLKPLETKVFKLAFKTGKKGQGYAKILFSNSFNSTNKEYLEFFGEADSSFSKIDYSEPSINNLSVYPNPSFNLLRIHFKSNSYNNIKIALIDLNGKTVKGITNKAYPIGENTIETDISDIESGNYIVELTNNNNRYNKKIYIKR